MKCSGKPYNLTTEWEEDIRQSIKETIANLSIHRKNIPITFPMGGVRFLLSSSPLSLC
jgi:hypothetical protein